MSVPQNSRYDNPTDDCCYCGGNHYSSQCLATRIDKLIAKRDPNWDNYFDYYDEVIQTSRDNWS